MASAATIVAQDTRYLREIDSGDAKAQLKLVTFRYTYADSYVSGGDPCDLSSYFTHGIIGVFGVPALDDTGAVVPRYNAAGQTMLAYTQTAADAYAQASGDLHLCTFLFVAIGH